MQRRQAPRYRRIEKRNRVATARERKRSRIPAIVVMVALLGALAVGVGGFVARTGSPAQSAQAVRGTSAVASNPASEQETATPISHVTFGAHDSATMACATCHPATPTDDIVCNSCHEGACGKNAKTVADCLACHKTGTTDRWVPDDEM